MRSILLTAQATQTWRVRSQKRAFDRGYARLPATWATWPSGKARVCKTLIAGSIPAVASNTSPPPLGSSRERCTSTSAAPQAAWGGLDSGADLGQPG